MGVNKFLTLLFNEGEHTCFSDTPKGIDIFHSWWATAKDAFFSINPMNPSKTRADSSVIKYRNILIEMDNMPLHQQEQYITELGLPYSTAVYSGSKSIHFIISLEQELPDEQSYRGLVKRIYRAVGEDKVDKSCKNPSRFSRLPGHIRLDTGQEQKLLAIKGRVPNEVLEQWLLRRGIGPEEIWENLTPEPRSTFKDYSRLYGATKYFLMYGADKDWNMKLFKASADLCRCGYNENEAIEELRNVTGHLDFNDIKTIRSAYKNELSKTAGA